MIRKLFLLVSILLVSLISYGQKRTKKLDDKVTKEERAKMTEEKRIVSGNQKKDQKAEKQLDYERSSESRQKGES